MKITFVYENLSSFVKTDLDILNKYYEVNDIQWNDSKSCKDKITKSITDSDLTFSWFASNHAYYTVKESKRLNKKSIVIVGGWEVAYFPHFNYGKFINNKDEVYTTYTLKHADKVLVVDKSLKQQAQFLMRDRCNNFESVPTGYDYSKFKNLGLNRNYTAITVAGIKRTNLDRKGLINFVNSAKELPNDKFIIVGKWIDDSINDLKSISPNNVIFTGEVSDNKLVELYNKTKIYYQVSIHEGLPNALCESMLCGCIPIGSYQNGIPRAIGDTGLYADYEDINEIVNAIKRGKASSNNQRQRVRNRIKHKFPLENREKQLIDIINGLC
jgi:glycosyltransferase involved in cell wall biosynthesis